MIRLPSRAPGARKWHLTRTAGLILVVSLVGAIGLATLTSVLNRRDSHRLLVLQAQDATVSIRSLLSQYQAAMSSIGSVAAATGTAADRLRALSDQNPTIKSMSTVAVLQRRPGGDPSATVIKGTLPANWSTPTGAEPGTDELTRALAVRGMRVLGFTGHGAGRQLSLAIGSPAVPTGYTVYAEVPLPEGMTVASPFPHLTLAVYNGITETSPLLFASTRDLPLDGDTVRQFIDINTGGAVSGPAPGQPALLFVVAAERSLLSTPEQILPAILAALSLVTGGLAAWAVQSAARRRDLAVATANHLKEKNQELDRAMARSMEAEQARQRLEADLQQAQRLEAVGQLAGGIAHDFNNLLMVIQTHVEFLAEEIPDDETVRGDLAQVSQAANRAADLTRRLLVFSRRDLIRPSVLNVNSSIAEVVELLQRSVGEDVKLTASLSENLPPVLCDAGELHQVLVNLVVNARQAIDGTGSITVSTSKVDLDSAVVPGHVELSPAVQISVADTGCGMSSEVASRAFEPYFTTKDPGSGTGLGLATVYGIVRRYGGYCSLESVEGSGTTVTVFLPATIATQEPTPEAPVDTAAPDGTPRVLLVEDEEGVRRACQRILEGGGYQVRSVTNADEALSAAAAGDFDVVLTDVVMPGGRSGRELAEVMQAARPGLPVLFMSGYNRDAIARRGVLEEGITVIEKPFTPEQLLGAIAAVLSTPAAVIG